MIVFRGTQKALKAMGINGKKCPDPGEGLLGSWFINIFHLERRKCALITNDQTLYSVLFFGLKKKDFEDIAQVFLAGLLENMRQDGFPVSTMAFVEGQGESIAVGKTNSRRVLGVMNEIVLTVKYLVAVKRFSVQQEIRVQNRTLNRTPWSGLELFDAVDMLREALFGLEDTAKRER